MGALAPAMAVPFAVVPQFMPGLKLQVSQAGGQAGSEREGGRELGGVVGGRRVRRTLPYPR